MLVGMVVMVVVVVFHCDGEGDDKIIATRLEGRKFALREVERYNKLMKLYGAAAVEGGRKGG